MSLTRGQMPAMPGRSPWGALADGALWLVNILLDDIAALRMVTLQTLKTKYMRNPMGLLLEFLQPVVICTAHCNFFELTGRPVPGNQYVTFTLGGFTIWFCFIGCYRQTIKLASRGYGVLALPGVTPMHLCLSTAIWSYFVYFTFAMLVSYPCRLLGLHVMPPDLGLTMMTYGISAAMGFGFGLMVWALAEVIPALGPFIKLFKWAIFVTSGIYDSIVTMSPVIAPYIWYNPLIHLAEYQRLAFYPGYPVYLVSLWYPFYWAVGLVTCGLLCNRALANRRPLRKFTG
jgi:capsular polysaccharide transport system permease protein